MKVESNIKLFDKMKGLGASNDGTILQFTGANFNILTPGVAGTVLTSNGTNAALTYATPSGGGGGSGTYDIGVKTHHGLSDSLAQTSTVALVLGSELRFNGAAGFAWVYELVADAAVDYSTISNVNLADDELTLSAAMTPVLQAEIGERVQFTSKDGTLPAPLAEDVLYYVASYVGGATPVITLSESPGAQPPLVLTTEGTGNIKILRASTPDWVWPSDWWDGSGVVAANNRRWELRRDPKQQYWTSVLVLDGPTAASATTYYAVRPVHSDRLIGWGITTKGPATALDANVDPSLWSLYTTGSDSEVPASQIFAQDISLPVGDYHAEMPALKSKHIPPLTTIPQGGSYWLRCNDAGDHPPNYIELHLQFEMRREDFIYM